MGRWDRDGVAYGNMRALYPSVVHMQTAFPENKQTRRSLDWSGSQAAPLPTPPSALTGLGAMLHLSPPSNDQAGSQAATPLPPPALIGLGDMQHPLLPH